MSKNSAKTSVIKLDHDFHCDFGCVLQFMLLKNFPLVVENHRFLLLKLHLIPRKMNIWSFSASYLWQELGTDSNLFGSVKYSK